MACMSRDEISEPTVIVKLVYSRSVVIVSAVVVMKAITVPSNTNPNPRKLQPIKVVVVLPSGLTVSSALPGTQMSRTGVFAVLPA